MFFFKANGQFLLKSLIETICKKLFHLIIQNLISNIWKFFQKCVTKIAKPSQGNPTLGPRADYFLAFLKILMVALNK